MVVKGVGDALKDDFESNATYFSSYPSEYITGDVVLESEHVYSGNSSLKLAYDFSTITNVRGAYANFNEPIIIEEGTKSINFWAYSEEKQPQVTIKMQIVDATGEEKLVLVKEGIDFTEWTELRFDLAEIALPAKLERIYTAQASGDGEENCIYIDNLTLTQKASGDISKITIPKNTKPYDMNEREENETQNGFSFAFYNKITDDGTLYSKIANSVDIFVTANGSIESANNVLNISTNDRYKLENSLLLTMDNQNQALTKEQWQWFVEQTENVREDNVFILLRDSFENAISDTQEKQIFADILTNLKNEGKNVIILYFGDTTGYSMYNGFKQFSVSNKQYNDAVQRVNNDEYIKFVVNDDEITYQVLSIYE